MDKISKTKWTSKWLNHHNLYLKDIIRIIEAPEIITHEDQISKLIEQPLIPMVTKIFRKNIETYMSSANTVYWIWLDIYYDSLSREDRALIDIISQNVDTTLRYNAYVWSRPIVRFLLPTIENTPVDQIEKWGNFIADQFQGQAIKIRTIEYTKNEIEKMIWVSSEEEYNKKIKDLKKYNLITYDEEKKLYYIK